MSSWENDISVDMVVANDIHHVKTYVYVNTQMDVRAYARASPDACT